LFSITGVEKELHIVEIKAGENVIDLNNENLPRGVYPVLIQSKTEKSAFKIIL